MNFRSGLFKGLRVLGFLQSVIFHAESLCHTITSSAQTSTVVFDVTAGQSIVAAACLQKALRKIHIKVIVRVDNDKGLLNLSVKSSSKKLNANLNFNLSEL